MEEPIKTIVTETGNIYLLPPKRTATEADSKRLHALIAKLLVEDYIERQEKASRAEGSS